MQRKTLLNQSNSNDFVGCGSKLGPQSIKNRPKNGGNTGRNLNIDFWSLLVGLGGGKIYPKSIKKASKKLHNIDLNTMQIRFPKWSTTTTPKKHLPKILKLRKRSNMSSQGVPKTCPTKLVSSRGPPEGPRKL